MILFNLFKFIFLTSLKLSFNNNLKLKLRLKQIKIFYNNPTYIKFVQKKVDLWRQNNNSRIENRNANPI